MICAVCGREFDFSLQEHCAYCRTVHNANGASIRTPAEILDYIAKKYGGQILLNARRTDSLIADLFPRESSARRMIFVALYDRCAAKLFAVSEKPFEVRSAAAARCVKSLRDEIGLKGRTAAELVEAVGQAVGCKISFQKTSTSTAAETESKKNITDSGEQYSLGRHFDRLRQYDKALYWFEQAAMQDYGEAEYYVGSYRLEGRSGIQDVAQAREWFLRGAENGVPACQYMTAYFYAEGFGGEISEAEAFRWFMAAAKAGYAQAASVIALCYENGVYVEKNIALAEKWRAFTQSGAPEPETEEAEPPQPLSDDGEELYQSARRSLSAKDFPAAAMFYQRAAELGHAKAQCSFGKCLYLGTGIEKDEKAAFEWFRKAAEQNLDIAQYNLGVMYLKGNYVEKDIAKARRWFIAAAKAGHKQSENVLRKIKGASPK